MPAGSAVADVESKLKKRYGKNKAAIYGTLNKIGLMRGNKPTAKGLKKAKKKGRRKAPHAGSMMMNSLSSGM